jgi:hypothetical protein
MKGCGESNTGQPEPRVGIFWLVANRLIVDASPLSEAEPYGDCLGHRLSHIRYWAILRKTGVVQPELEYDDFPRGRVTYNAKKQEFYFLADTCILKDKAKVAKIKKLMYLPASTIVDTDLHYKCPGCDKSESKREQEEADWDF